MNLFFKSIIVSIVMVMLVTFTSPLATFAINNSAEDVDNSIEDLEAVLKFYFDEIGELTDKGYVIKDEDAFNAKILIGDPAALKLKELISQEPALSTASAASFGKCVVNKMVGSYGNIARQWLNGAIFTYIKTKQYDLAARLMFNSLVKAGFKVNAATLAIEVSYYGWQCRGKF
ncbi:hypothetical protein VSS76_13420 [Bacillus safensis]|uniref:hypothetical protein n=1 Tax=Bacillus TaxID=1386 RepID=UPI00293D07CF|nr:hypothetical protein [Bacillus safensis]MDV3451204.1 hypothetical protein [Bacillus safensis]MEC4588273.1 hypothetical protein [Bacillus safensis]MEC4628960.1 hypothetical protein [Bacillus safensis]